jgi:hypothetical protein
MGSGVALISRVVFRRSRAANKEVSHSLAGNGSSMPGYVCVLGVEAFISVSCSVSPSLYFFRNIMLKIAPDEDPLRRFASVIDCQSIQ